jgi:hypothetical protein
MGGRGSGNPNPKIENLKPFKPVGAESLGNRLTVRFSKPVEAVLESMTGSEKQTYIRQAVEEKMLKDGLL